MKNKLVNKFWCHIAWTWKEMLAAILPTAFLSICFLLNYNLTWSIIKGLAILSLGIPIIGIIKGLLF